MVILRPTVNKVVMNIYEAQLRVSQHFERRRMVLTRVWLGAMHAAGCDAVSISLVAQTRSQSCSTCFIINSSYPARG